MKKTHKIILALILVLLLLANFRWGFFILGNDNYSPEENPSLSLSRYIQSPGWREYRGLGVPSDSEQVDIIRSFVFTGLEKIGVPIWLVSQLSIWFVFICGIISAGLIGKWFYQKFSGKDDDRAFLLSGIFYFSNLLTIWLFFSPLKPFIYVWGFLPLIIWTSLKLAQKFEVKNFLFFIIALLLFSLAAVIPTIFFVALGVYILFLILFGVVGVDVKKLGLIFLFIFLFELFWLIPFIFYVFSNSSALVDSYINRMITPNTIGDEQKYNTLGNIVRYITAWIDTKSDNGELLFSQSATYQHNLIFILVSWLPPFFAFWGAFFVFIKKKWPLAGLIIIFILGIIFIKGPNPPFGEIYVFFQKYIPLFKQVFRWSSSKFWPLLALSLPFLATIGVLSLANLSKPLSKIIVAVAIVSQLIFVYPFFAGQLVGKNDYVQIPQNYYDLKNYLFQNNITDRIYIAPEANMLYFRDHNWGFFGSVFMSYLIPNPVMEKAFITGSQENESAYLALTNAYYSENSQLFTRALNQYRIEWLLSDKSLSSKNNGYDFNWNIHQKVVEQNTNLEKVWQKGYLTLYKVQELGNVAQSLLFYNNLNWPNVQKTLLLNQNYSNIISKEDNSQAGTIPIFLLKNDSIVVEDLGLKVTHRYFGPNSDYQTQIPTDISKLPIKGRWDQNNNTIEFYPALPTVAINSTEILNSEYYSGLKLAISDEIKFITLGNNLWDLATNETVFFNNRFNRLTNKTTLRVWNDKKETSKDKKFNITKDSILQIDISLSVQADGLYSVCLFSKNKQVCLNKNSFFEVTSIPRHINITQFVSGPDQLEVLISNEIQVDDLMVDQYSENSLVNPKDFSDILSSSSASTVLLKNKDLISTRYPYLLDENSYYLNGNRLDSIPEVFAKENIYLSNNGVVIKSKEKSAGFYVKFSAFEQGNRLYMLSAGAKNVLGVPLDINFRDAKQQYKIFSDRIGYEKENQIFGTLVTPEESHNYILEAYLYGKGNGENINSLNYLLFQPVPEGWTDIKLNPVSPKTIGNIFSLNQAYHPYWQATENGKVLEKVRLNGWEQGFIVSGQGNADVKVKFLLTDLTKAGYVFSCLLILAAVLVLFLYHRKSSSRAKN